MCLASPSEIVAARAAAVRLELAQQHAGRDERERGRCRRPRVAAHGVAAEAADARCVAQLVRDAVRERGCREARSRAGGSMRESEGERLRRNGDASSARRAPVRNSAFLVIRRSNRWFRTADRALRP